MCEEDPIQTAVATLEKKTLKQLSSITGTAAFSKTANFQRRYLKKYANRDVIQTTNFKAT